jgi:hypothetical protein
LSLLVGCLFACFALFRLVGLLLSNSFLKGLEALSLFSWGEVMLPAFRKQYFCRMMVTACHFIFRISDPCRQLLLLDFSILNFTSVTEDACSWTNNKNVSQQARFHY